MKFTCKQIPTFIVICNIWSDALHQILLAILPVNARRRHPGWDGHEGELFRSFNLLVCGAHWLRVVTRPSRVTALAVTQYVTASPHPLQVLLLMPLIEVCPAIVEKDQNTHLTAGDCERSARPER